MKISPEVRLMNAIRNHTFVTSLDDKQLASLLLSIGNDLPADSLVSLILTEGALRLCPTLFQEETSQEGT